MREYGHLKVRDGEIVERSTDQPAGKQADCDFAVSRNNREEEEGEESWVQKNKRLRIKHRPHGESPRRDGAQSRFDTCLRKIIIALGRTEK